ncbi:YihY/virulence factor BrkB family protein [Longibacter salinarum]|nr:YihY/virulence factor BrkB family protein [Longibacter salinarum]
MVPPVQRSDRSFASSDVEKNKTRRETSVDVVRDVLSSERAADVQSVVRQTFSEFVDDDCPRMAAALAYYTVFSLPPLVVIVVTLTGVFLSPETVESWIQTEVGTVIGSGTAEQVQEMAMSAQERVMGGFSLGLILSIAGLLFGATGAFAQMQSALNKAWEVQPDPKRSGVWNLVMKRVLSFGMILVIAFLLLVSLLLSSVLAAVSGQIGELLPSGLSGPFVWLINALVDLLVITALFAAIFRVLPDATLSWRDVAIGAFVTALLFVAGKFLISLYIGHSNPAEVFGAATALALLLVWVYYSAMILFLGAEFTQVWTRRHGHGIQPADGAVRIVTTTAGDEGEEKRKG